MVRFLRILRGGLATAIVWAGTWTLGTIALRFAMTIPGNGARSTAMPPLLYVAMIGAMSGLLFAIFLVSERRQRLTDFSVRRVGLLGATAALILPLGWTIGSLALHPNFFSEVSPIPLLVAYATAGALTAAGSFVLALKPTGTPPSDSGGLLGAPLPEIHTDRRAGAKSEATRPNQALLQSAAKLSVAFASRARFV